MQRRIATNAKLAFDYKRKKEAFGRNGGAGSLAEVGFELARKGFFLEIYFRLNATSTSEYTTSDAVFRSANFPSSSSESVSRRRSEINEDEGRGHCSRSFDYPFPFSVDPAFLRKYFVIREEYLFVNRRHAPN